MTTEKQLSNEKKLAVHQIQLHGAEKKHITFFNILAAVRLEILCKTNLSKSDGKPHMENYSYKIRHLRFLLAQAVA